MQEKSIWYYVKTSVASGEITSRLASIRMSSSLGCRFITLNDGLDTIRKNNEMLVILNNVMNDLYARDTSSKIRADKHIMEIDPVTAPIVRRIFDMHLQEDIFRKIARLSKQKHGS